jgi:hypothetical protein
VTAKLAPAGPGSESKTAVSKMPKTGKRNIGQILIRVMSFSRINQNAKKTRTNGRLPMVCGKRGGTEKGRRLSAAAF